MTKTVDPQGGVFVPVPGKQQRPAYSWGPDGRRQVMFQCPVSAIPDVVWELLEAWYQCRMMRCLPEAGGWVDQAKLVRRSFPIFEQQQLNWDEQHSAPARTAAALAGMAAATSARGK